LRESRLGKKLVRKTREERIYPSERKLKALRTSQNSLRDSITSTWKNHRRREIKGREEPASEKKSLRPGAEKNAESKGRGGGEKSKNGDPVLVALLDQEIGANVSTDEEAGGLPAQSEKSCVAKAI